MKDFRFQFTFFSLFSTLRKIRFHCSIKITGATSQVLFKTNSTMTVYVFKCLFIHSFIHSLNKQTVLVYALSAIHLCKCWVFYEFWFIIFKTSLTQFDLQNGKLPYSQMSLLSLLRTALLSAYFISATWKFSFHLTIITKNDTRGK